MAEKDEINSGLDRIAELPWEHVTLYVAHRPAEVETRFNRVLLDDEPIRLQNMELPAAQGRAESLGLLWPARDYALSWRLETWRTGLPRTLAVGYYIGVMTRRVELTRFDAEPNREYEGTATIRIER